MNARAYILLDVNQGKVEQVVRTLRSKPGVKTVDLLDGPPDVVLMLEARSRKKLVQFTLDALEIVEAMIEGTHVLPVSFGPVFRPRVPAAEDNLEAA